MENYFEFLILRKFPLWLFVWLGRRNNVIHMEMTLSNKALSGMQGFAIQLNKNRFGEIAY